MTTNDVQDVVIEQEMKIIEVDGIPTSTLDPNRELFPDVMLDIETTGTDQGSNIIIQIAAVKFNLAEQTISHDFFDRCLLPLPGRYWDEDCRINFWGKMPEIYASLAARMEDPKLVLDGLVAWAGRHRRMWAKPTHFDHSFLTSYYQQVGGQIPFAFYTAKDMNSFIEARYFPAVAPKWDKLLPFKGDKHNGLHDCLHQIEALFHAVNDTKVTTGLQPLIVA